jgi:hypothetical protein
MERTMNPIVKKIVKLMKLAEDQVGTPEGETAARIAAKLITAHAVKQEQLREGGEEAEDKIVRLTRWKKCNNIWERSLWHVVSMYMDCKMWFNGPYKKWDGWGADYAKYRISIAGYASSVEVVNYLYEICHSQIRKACRKQTKGMTQTQKKGFRRSAVQGLQSKLNALKHEARNEASTAIVLKNRYERVLESIADMNLQNSRNTRSRYSQNGYEAGRNININAGINGKNNKRLA